MGIAAGIERERIAIYPGIGFGKDAAGNPWYFTRCTLGDTVYNFDVATELSVRKGEGLTCFAMTDKELQTGGLQKGFTYSDNEKAPAVKMKKKIYSRNLTVLIMVIISFIF